LELSPTKPGCYNGSGSKYGGLVRDNSAKGDKHHVNQQNLLNPGSDNQ
jgi:hypothetical protein